MKTKNKSILGTMIVAALAAPTLALAGDRDDFPRDAVIRKAKEAIEIAEDVTYEYETFLRDRTYCAPNHHERALLTGLKELERRAGHVIKAAVTGCMPTTIERRSEYLRNVVEKTDILAVRVGVNNLPCDIPGELVLIDELACEISAFTRARVHHRDSDRHAGNDIDGRDRHTRNDFDSRGRRDVDTRHVVPTRNVPAHRPVVREVPAASRNFFHGSSRGRHTATNTNPYLHRRSASFNASFGSRGLEFRICR